MGTSKQRRKHSSEFKKKVAIEAIQERSSLAEIGKKYQLHVNQISKWKSDLIEHGASVFEQNNKQEAQHQQEKDSLLRMVGTLQMENEWLKKKL